MRQGGAKLAAIVASVSAAAKPGVSKKELEQLAEKLISSSGGESSFKGFHGYPAVSCLSLNNEVVHGLPSDTLLREGDLLGVDIGLRYKEYCTDMAITVPIGDISAEARRLLEVTEKALAVGLAVVRPGCRLGDLGSAIQREVEMHGLGIVRDLTGHGIGRSPHEEPSIPNFGQPGKGMVLEEGMVLAIEPMVSAGTGAVKQLADGWTIVTFDNSLAAHFEHTVVVTSDGCKILTKE